VRAIPGEGLSIPVWILGSSLFGAQLAAMLGLPYAFASHFAPGADGGGGPRSTASTSSRRPSSTGPM
jgi:alkanesulfonate monooxygenase SsuD/methylene tetrahydromethanopterin reductase-like flavin-dependent oxidoreductase (luciferase family)